MTGLDHKSVLQKARAREKTKGLLDGPTRAISGTLRCDVIATLLVENWLAAHENDNRTLIKNFTKTTFFVPFSRDKIRVVGITIKISDGFRGEYHARGIYKNLYGY